MYVGKNKTLVLSELIKGLSANLLGRTFRNKSQFSKRKYMDMGVDGDGDEKISFGKNE